MMNCTSRRTLAKMKAKAGDKRMELMLVVNHLTLPEFGKTDAKDKCSGIGKIKSTLIRNIDR